MNAGFTAVDTLALGAMGHVVGVGAVLGLKVRCFNWLQTVLLV